MARTEEEIQTQLKESITDSDETLDTEQGPIPDIMVRPQAGPLAEASREAEDLRLLFTLQFENSATDNEVQNALANYGSTPGVGFRSSHIQYFMRFTKPTGDVEIPAGTLVSDSDGTLVYRVINGGTILESAADSFKNASRGTYEIGLTVEAVASGAEYELPPRRVNTLVTPTIGIDSVENRKRSEGGTEKETKDQQSERLKTSLQGVNLGAPGGITKLIQDAFPELATDVATIQPFEKEFSRIVDSPALDVYIIGERVKSFTETFEATAGQTELPLSKVPVSTVTNFTVNGVAGIITGTLIQDTSHETGFSIRANDYVLTSAPLLAGDEVIIEYEYNGLLESIETDVFDSGEDYLFNTDMLLREPLKIPPKITGEVKSLPSFTSTEVEENLAAFFAELFQFTTFQEIVYPEEVRQRVLIEVSGVQGFIVTEFRRSTGALAGIEPIAYDRNETSIYDSTLINVKVTT